MFSMHLVEHHLDVVPLPNFVETMLWVGVHTPGGALIGKNGEKGAEEAFTHHFSSRLVAGAFASTGSDTGRCTHRFLNEADSRVGHDGHGGKPENRSHGGAFNHHLGNSVEENATVRAGE